MRKRTSILVALLLACFAWPEAARAGTLGAEADSFVMSSAAQQSANFGTDTVLRVKNAAGTTNTNDDPATVDESASRKAFIRFDLSTVIGTVDSAALRLTVDTNQGGTAVSGTQTFNVFGLNDGDAGEGWSETGITWLNAPQNDLGSRAGMEAGATLLGTFTLVGSGTNDQVVSFTNAALLTFLNADTDDQATFVVSRDTFDSNHSGFIHAFVAREDGARTGPELEFTATAVPEPGSAAVVALAIFGLGAARRPRS